MMAVSAENDCNVVAAPVVLQDEQQRTSVPTGVSVRRRPARRRHRSHALPEILSCWTHHVHPRVSRHHHTEISGIRLHQLPAAGRRYCVSCHSVLWLKTHLWRRVTKCLHRGQPSTSMGGGEAHDMTDCDFCVFASAVMYLKGLRNAKPTQALLASETSNQP